MLTARSLKCTLVLNPAELAALPDPPNGVPRATLTIAVAGRTLTADIAAKSLRKAKATIAEHGAEQVALILQGKLEGDTVAEAGLAAQVKTPAAAA